MTNRYASTNSTASAELAADQGGCRDKKVLQALVTAGALVALAEGHLENVERDEVVGFVHRQDFVPTISYSGIAKAFDNRVRELEERPVPDHRGAAAASRPIIDLGRALHRGASRCCRSDNSSRRGASNQAGTLAHAGE